MPKHRPASIPSELIEQKIYLIRGHKVMIDAHLAKLYRVTIHLYMKAPGR